MRATINEVAAQAGVSIKTVSRVINNEASVRPSTRKKVQEAIAALQYQPNLAARNLAAACSYTIALIYDNPNAYYIIDMQNGILKTCKARGYELLIHPSNSKSNHINDELRALVERSKIAGLILTPPFSESESVIKTVKQLKLDYVRIVSSSAAKQDADNCIQVDDNTAAYEITRHLIAHGHRNIGFLCGGQEHVSTYGRLQGYRRALQQAGIAVDPALIIDGEYSFDSGVTGAKKLLQSAVRPSAIFASNDEMAAGALFAARLMRLDIPQQLSVVGFEDSPFSRQTWPKLTTAHQPNTEIAKCAAMLLLNKARNKGAASTVSPNKDADIAKQTFVPELLVRDSTGPAPKN